MHKNFFHQASFNTPLFESKNFIVIPSLGSMVPGWVLIVPRNYHLSLSSLSPSLLNELSSITQTAERAISNNFGENIIMFEHGPKGHQSPIGCGVDYAHLHLLPFDYDLMLGLQTFLKIEYEWTKIKGLMDLNKFSNVSKDYLYYRNHSSNHFVTFQQNVQSQLFRKVIACYLNTPENFDWTAYPELDKIQTTIKELHKSNIVHERPY